MVRNQRVSVGMWFFWDTMATAMTINESQRRREALTIFSKLIIRQLFVALKFRIRFIFWIAKSWSGGYWREAK